MINLCPNCQSDKVIKSGVVHDRQRFKCKSCNHHFSVNKLGKKIDDYYVNKALQLYLEGLTYREIERILGISHVTILNWVKKFNIKRPQKTDYHPAYRILTAEEVAKYFSDKSNLKGAGVVPVSYTHLTLPTNREV